MTKVFVNTKEVAETLRKRSWMYVDSEGVGLLKDAQLIVLFDMLTRIDKRLARMEARLKRAPAGSPKEVSQ